MDNSKRGGVYLCCPRKYCHLGVSQIGVRELTSRGVKAVLLDLDNTLVPWQRHEVSDAVRDWLSELKENGIKLCLISNTRFGKRLKKLSEELDIPYIRHAWKPGKRGYLSALKELDVSPAETVMVGDQMFTDVLGGNRLGIYTVMVKPIAHREFVGTKVSRVAESALLFWFRRCGVLQEDDAPSS